MTGDLRSYLTQELGYQSHTIESLVEPSQRLEEPPQIPASFPLQSGDVVFYRRQGLDYFNHAALVIGWGLPTYFQSERKVRICSPILPWELERFIDRGPGLVPWIKDRGGPGYARAFNDIGAIYEIEFVHIPDFLGEW